MQPPATILVVDDELDLRENIALALESDGYTTLTASDGLEALNLLANHQIDLILADIAMPNMNGYQLFERVQENPLWVMIPFIFLSARSLDTDIHYGKQLGVDDYLTKPIRANDLTSVVQGKLRRARQIRQTVADMTAISNAEQKLYSVGEIKVDPVQHRAWLKGAELSLSAREFTLLLYLAQRAGEVISPQELVIVTHEFETDNVEAGALVRPLILGLRRKLSKISDDGGSLIENVRGVGYRLVG